MRRATLDHPSRAILIHIPTGTLDHLDAVAREAHLSRSEVVRQLLAPPIELCAARHEEAMATAQDQPARRRSSEDFRGASPDAAEASIQPSMPVLPPVFRSE